MAGSRVVTERTEPLLVAGREAARGAFTGRLLRVAGLFAGIGGIERGLHRAGHVTELMCENDPGAVAVLKRRFPTIELHEDVRSLRALPDVDLLAAGFPCQDLSQAGKTLGINGENSGLVSEVFRLLRQRAVPWVLLENVPFMMQLSKGRALEVVLRSLEELGYEWAYRVVDTQAFGLPQRRRRVFILGSLEGDPRTVLFHDESGRPPDPPSVGVACGFYWTEGTRGLGWAVDAIPTLKGGSAVGIPSPPAIVLPTGEIVKPHIKDAERLQGFPADWTKSAESAVRPSMRWKCVGNAVSVPVAEWLGKRLRTPGDYSGRWDEVLLDGERWPEAAWSDGHGRYTANLSTWPVKRRARSLHEFLRFEPTPLSAKATAGFFRRAQASSLRFPDGFLDVVERHLERVSS